MTDFHAELAELQRLREKLFPFTIEAYPPGGKVVEVKRRAVFNLFQYSLALHRLLARVISEQEKEHE